MERNICAFNELSVGDIFKYGGVTCIKVDDKWNTALCWLNWHWEARIFYDDDEVEQTYVGLEDIFKGEDI